MAGERVHMVLPEGMKERIRKAGRGTLTAFITEACEERLTGLGSLRELEREVDHLRYLVQALADRYAVGGDKEDREAFLMEVDLPSWVVTEGWPRHLARQVLKEDETGRRPKPSAKPVLIDRGGKAAEEERTPTPPAFTTTQEPVQAQPPAGSKGADLFERVSQVASEKGLDLSASGLRPASEIPKPARQLDPEPEPEPTVSDLLGEDEEDDSSADEVELSQAGKCGNCGAELVGNECWTCWS